MLFPLFPQRELADILLKREPTVLDGMNSRAIQTALHRIRLLERRISFLEKKVPADELVILPASNGDGHRKRFRGFYEKAHKTIADLGLTPQQIDVLREFGLLATDNVTGFQEGRSGPARFETLKDAIRHVTVTGERAYYISMDLQNLGGLNSKLGHTGANEVFSRIAGIIEVFLAAMGKDVVLFRHGGDELSAMIFNVNDFRLSATFQKITQAIEELSGQFGLEYLEHPKNPGDPRYFGTGLHFAIVPIRPEDASHPQRIFQTADVLLEQRKKTPINWGPEKMAKEVQRLLSICRKGGRGGSACIERCPRASPSPGDCMLQERACFSWAVPRLPGHAASLRLIQPKMRIAVSGLAREIGT